MVSRFSIRIMSGAGRAITPDKEVTHERIAADMDALGMGLPPLPPGFEELRWSLTDEEVARYRESGRRASAAMEAAWSRPM